MKRTINAAVVSFLLVLGTAWGAAAENRVIIGAGLESCGTWTRLRRQGRSPERSILENWVAGFVSASNLNETFPEVLFGTDSNGLEGWIDNYCSSNPLKAVAFAATGLMTELRAQKQSRQ